MNFNYELTAVEYLFIGLFLLFYALYIARTVWVARALGATARVILIKFFLRSIYFALMLMALLGPFFGEPERDLVAEGKDIMVVVDISHSMTATDVPPSRLQKVKFELQRLTASLQGNRFGLILFSSNAFLQVPLTFDLSAFELFLQSLNTGRINGGGTDICSALELALQKFRQSRSNTSKIILLFTDGENFGTCERKTLASLRQFDIQMMIVGVGTIAGGHLRKNNLWLKDEDGRLVTTRLNNQYLREMAMVTNGSYFEISNQLDVLPEVVKAISQVKNQLIDSRNVVITSNKYRYFLVIALVLIALDVLVTITTLKI